MVALVDVTTEDDVVDDGLEVVEEATVVDDEATATVDVVRTVDPVDVEDPPAPAVVRTSPAA